MCLGPETPLKCGFKLVSEPEIRYLFESSRRGNANRLVFGYTFDSPLVFFHPLYGPKHLNARILPSDAKNAVSIYFANRLPELEMLVDELYSDNIPRREELKIGIRRHLERWEQFMHHEDKSDMMPKFWRFTDGLDRLRSESMQECMPRFYDILKGNK